MAVNYQMITTEKNITGYHTISEHIKFLFCLNIFCTVCTTEDQVTFDTRTGNKNPLALLKSIM